MEAQISGRHIQISDPFRGHAEEKLEALDKYADQIQRCGITIWKDGENRCVEVLIRVRKGPDVVAEARELLQGAGPRHGQGAASA